MISPFLVYMFLKFTPGDKILWGDKLDDGQYACKGLVIKQDGKLLHVDGVCHVYISTSSSGKKQYLSFAVNGYITTKDVKEKLNE